MATSGSRTRSFARVSYQDTTLGITNFKSIGSVELPPVRMTVLAGSNSSGKSSLLQSALFFAQSLAAGTPVINGDLVRLGEPGDVIRDGTDEVGFEVSFDEAHPDEDEVERNSFRVTLKPKDEELVPAEAVLRSSQDVWLEAQGSVCPAALTKRLQTGEGPLKISKPQDFQLPSESFLTMRGIEPGRLVYRASKDAYRGPFEELLSSERMTPFL